MKNMLPTRIPPPPSITGALRPPAVRSTSRSGPRAPQYPAAGTSPEADPASDPSAVGVPVVSRSASLLRSRTRARPRPSGLDASGAPGVLPRVEAKELASFGCLAACARRACASLEEQRGRRWTGGEVAFVFLFSLALFPFWFIWS